MVFLGIVEPMVRPVFPATVVFLDSRVFLALTAQQEHLDILVFLVIAELQAFQVLVVSLVTVVFPVIVALMDHQLQLMLQTALPIQTTI